MTPSVPRTTPGARRMRRLLPFALAGLLFLTLIPGLASVEALDWREARDAQVARETLHGPEDMTPLYAREAFFEKPIAGFVHEFVAQRVLRRLVPGVERDQTDVATSRAVRALLAAVLALLVAVIGTRAFGQRAGWLAGCALASAVGLPLAARADGGQLLATLFAWLGVGSLLSVLQGRSRHPDLARLGAWFALGVAALTGGPMSALWPVGGLALYFGLARTRAPWRLVRPVEGMAIVIGMMLPWYGVMAVLWGDTFLSRVAWFPYAMETRGHWLSGAITALSYTVVLGFPWSPLLGASLRDAILRLQLPRRGEAQDLRDSGHASGLLLAMLIAAGVPVALYPGPPLTAALPALPAIALLCGRFLDRVLDGDVEARHLSVATQFTALLGTLLALFAVTLATRLGDAAHGLQMLAATLLLTSWAPFLADFRHQRKLAAALFALPVALGAPILMTQVLPPLEPWLNTRRVAETMESVAPSRAPLALIEAELPSLRLLLPRNLVHVDDANASLDALVARDGWAYVAFRPAREADVLKSATRKLDVLVRTPTLVLARVHVQADSSAVR